MARYGMVLMIFAVTACAPKDEKVSGAVRSGNSGAEVQLSSGFPNRNDRSPEYARALLGEINDVTRKLEGVLGEVERTLSKEPQTPRTLASCETLKDAVAPLDGMGVLKYTLAFDACEEVNSDFQGKMAGSENYLAVLTKATAEGTLGESSSVASEIRVDSQNLNRDLKQAKNPRDWIALKSFSHLQAELVAQTELALTYKVSGVSSSLYSLEVKSFTDTGTIQYKVSVFADYDRKSKKVVRVWTDDGFGDVAIKVLSARLPRNGRQVLRQEFLSSVDVSSPLKLQLDVSECAMPQGAFRTSFSIRNTTTAAEAKTLVFEQKQGFESVANEIRVVLAGDSSKTDTTPGLTKIGGEVCTSQKSPSWTFGFQNLLY